MGARTGGSTDNHWVDNLNITTINSDPLAGQPSITAISPVPVGQNASAMRFGKVSRMSFQCEAAR